MESQVEQVETGHKPQKRHREDRAVPKWRVVVASVPFFAVHIACIAVLWVGWSWFAVAACLFLYALRVFAVTAGYHRYFSHRSFRTSRPMQFVFALLGTTAAQKGPLWWAALHRHHHRYADTEEDIHPPTVKGFWWSHVGWILSPRYEETRFHAIRDFARFPELRFLNRYHLLPPVALAVGLFLLGWALHHGAPSLGTSGWQLLVWGFFLSTVLLWHVTFCVNSANRKLFTFGEGWHNNHHRFPGSERQGFFWWEVDFTHYLLKLLSWCGLVWDLREPPAWVYTEARRGIFAKPQAEAAD